MAGRNSYSQWLWWLLPVAGLAIILATCSPEQLDITSVESMSLEPPPTAPLAAASHRWREHNNADSGFHSIPEGRVALGTRLQLIDAAQSSIDAQYFLMKEDKAGYLFASSLLAAADRGVRVRFLLDDIYTTVKDASLVLLDTHPNIEVRLFNPIERGGFYWAKYLLQFERTNRRMHNKTLIVDQYAGIIGGRNIADEYFDLRAGSGFIDFDLFLLGDAASATTAGFDQFWNHPLSMPISAYLQRVPEALLRKVRDRASAAMATATGEHYDAIRSAGLLDEVLNDQLPLVPGEAAAVTDSPEKLLAPPDKEQQILVNRLKEVIAGAREEVLISTPYLIPGPSGVEFFRDLVARGMRVVILTNSLASNNHVAAHGAYQRYRESLLDAGVELFEVRATAADVYYEFGALRSGGEGRVNLHTKAIVIDRRWVLAGSLNLDPRAVNLNTEFGLLIDSPPLADELAARFEQRLQGTAYQLQHQHGQLQWTAVIGDETVTLTKEPDASLWRRVVATLSTLLPESQL